MPKLSTQCHAEQTGQAYVIECTRTWFCRAVDLTTLTLDVVCATLLRGRISTANLPRNTVRALAEQASDTGAGKIAPELAIAAKAGPNIGIDVSSTANG